MAISQLEERHDEQCYVEQPEQGLPGVRPQRLVQINELGEAGVELSVSLCLIAEGRKELHESRANPEMRQKIQEAKAAEWKTIHQGKRAVTVLSLEDSEKVRSTCPVRGPGLAEPGREGRCGGADGHQPPLEDPDRGRQGNLHQE